MFLMKVRKHGLNLRQKFQANLEYVFRESDENAPLPFLRSLKTKD